ncbi:UDP-glucose 4-epimerase GalE [uncultured Clostridium sp.]|uniref:UDP-glucose 4-epimerase GalE n=1 Tax=uncultured Clostridium sp. TaxID=59620 RepID=UPI00258D0EBB|nr:UDP-glucose 4-epimerase GalE [uncultured Clostridium sp.]
MRNILVTGGIGYIGSHTTIELLEKDYNVVILDNLSNSNIRIKDRIEILSGKKIKFYEGDILDNSILNKIFEEENIDTVIHFAAYKSVGDSVKMPLEYYNNNINGTVNLLRAMKRYEVKNIIFSSSATVYGEAKVMPVSEKTPLMTPTNPYGKTKSMMEEILTDVYKSDNSWNVVLLRYFNPVGAHESGLIGEMPNGIPNNLMPYISKVAAGELEYISVFGDDYNTIDGTGVRDYIHVVDLASGHVKALNKIEEKCGLKIYNLGTGDGYSVLQVIKAFEKAANKKINYKIVERRPGDIGTCYADPKLAKEELGWEAKYEIDKMCEDFWRWQCTGLKSLIEDEVLV